MAGTRIGGQKAAQTNKLKHGDDFYRNIGRKGGKLGRTGGFYKNRELARIAGQKGGRISRRGPAKPKDDWSFLAVQDDEPILPTAEPAVSWGSRIVSSLKGSK